MILGLFSALGSGKHFPFKCLTAEGKIVYWEVNIGKQPPIESESNKLVIPQKVLGTLEEGDFIVVWVPGQKFIREGAF